MKIALRIASLAVVTTLLTWGGVRNVSAASSHQDLAEKLAVKYNLNSQDVEKFITNYYEHTSETKISAQYSDHLKFIESKLDAGVAKGELSKAQKKALMDKLAKMMEKGPRAEQYSSMSERELTKNITAWKKDMKNWSQKHGIALDTVRTLTGKGNKYLMGIEID